MFFFFSFKRTSSFLFRAKPLLGMLAACEMAPSAAKHLWDACALHTPEIDHRTERCAARVSLTTACCSLLVAAVKVFDSTMSCVQQSCKVRGWRYFER